MTEHPGRGHLDLGGAGPAVRLERYLPDPPAAVWQAITDRAQLREWFPCDVIVDGGRWEVGAAITFPFPSGVIDMTLTGTVLAVEEPSLLSYTWGDGEVLRFELRPEGAGTRLVLTDQLPPGWAARNAAGWEDCLDRLAGLPADPGAWQRRFTAFAAAFEPSLGPQEGPPADFKGDLGSA
jgi:uncharacterized protein YndB with AHSA1/START domain